MKRLKTVRPHQMAFGVLILILLGLGILYNLPQAKWMSLHFQSCSGSFDYFYKNKLGRTFSVKWDSQSESNWGALLAEEQVKHSKPLMNQNIHFKLKSDWYMSVIDQQDDHFVVMNELIHPEISLENDHLSDLNQNRELANHISRKFYIKMNKNGEVLALQADPSLRLIEKNIIRWLVARFQVILPEKWDGNIREWISSESDPNGEYESRYSVVHQNSAQLEVKKQKLRYLSFNKRRNKRSKRFQNNLEVNLKVEPYSDIALQIDCARGIPQRIVGKEKLDTQMGERLIAQTQDLFEFTFKSETPVSDGRLQFLLSEYNSGNSKQPTFRLVAEESAEDMEKIIQKTELGDLTEEQLFALLAKAKKSGDSQAVDALYLKLKALIYLHPEVCSKIEHLLENEDSHSKVMSVLATALSTVGSPQAQQALVKALEVRADDVEATQILVPALGMTDHPTVESEEALRKLIKSSNQEDVITTAGLSLGIMAANLGEESPQRQKQILESVHQDFENAQTPEQKKFLISVLGNAGSSSSISLIHQAMKSSDPSLQAEAVMALRWVPGKDVDDKLIQVLSENQNEEVKKSAASALGFREPSLLLSERMRSLFTQEKSDWVRREIVKNEFEHRRVDPEVKNWLRWVKDHDPSQDVRKIAKDYDSLENNTN